MPTNRRRTKRTPRVTLLPDEIRDFLITGEEKNTAVNAPYRWEIYSLQHTNEGLSPYWPEHRDKLLEEYIRKRPGTRPWAWWRVDAPRDTWAEDEDSCYKGKLPIPRKRLGGNGETSGEHYESRETCFQFGVPDSWHWINPDDPPMFESEPAYLKRLGLLSPAEEKRLSAADYQPVSIAEILGLDMDELRQEYEDHVFLFPAEEDLK